MEKFTDFGFKKVKIGEKSGLVKEVFDNVASKYDIMNDLMSTGLHRLWKDKMVEEISLKRGNSYKFLDVAGGTGDISFRIAKKCQKLNIEVDVEVSDINQEMLDVGKKRAIDNNLLSGLSFNCVNGEELPYEDNTFDFYTIAFGIRNFTHIDKGLAEAQRVLKPGGKFICLEFSKVNNAVLSKLYDLYSFNVIPKIGKLIADDEESYRYLAQSIKKFPSQENFKIMMEDAGFQNASYQSLTFGTVAIHTGLKSNID
jgi:demethylmenaquinone methyltransferase/2-methoxy-6-polyprenyl-1,4-benzoquinol methylase